MDQIVLFGDSLTQQSAGQDRGFAFKPALETAYIRRLDVLNRGHNGYNTSQALQILPHIIPSAPSPTTSTPRIRLFTIFFGANDARLPNTPPANPQTIALPEFTSNIRRIATFPALVAHNPTIVLITPPPIDERMCVATDNDKGYDGTTRRRTAGNTAAYAAAVRDLGKELNLPVVDLWAAFMREAGHPGVYDPKNGQWLPGASEIAQNETLVRLMHDGLHFNPEGYRILYREFMGTIESEVPDLMPERMPKWMPEWDNEDAWRNFGSQ